MRPESKCSKYQLELQKRVSQNRIDEIHRVLSSGVQASLNTELNEDGIEILRRVYDLTLSDADIDSCISLLELLLLSEGLPALVDLVMDASRSSTIRRRAAYAICKIGPERVKDQLSAMKRHHSAEVRALAAIALGQK